jgi:hypothetical protein
MNVSRSDYNSEATVTRSLALTETRPVVWSLLFAPAVKQRLTIRPARS